MFFGKKAQGAIEYLLIIGAAILIVAMVILAATGAMSSGKNSATTTLNDEHGQVDTLRSLVPGAATVINGHTYFKEDSVTSGIVGLWHLDEASGNVVDEKNSITGAVIGASRVPGLIGSGALSFDPANEQNVVINSIPGLSNSQGSVSVWFKANSWRGAGGWNYLFSLGETTDGELEVRNENNSLNILSYKYPGPYISKYYALPSLGVNHNLVLTWTGTTLKYYLDGVLNQTIDISAYNGINSFGNKSILGGTSYTGRTWSGIIDEFVIWNRALSADEVATLYNNTNK